MQLGGGSTKATERAAGRAGLGQGKGEAGRLLVSTEVRHDVSTGCHVGTQRTNHMFRLNGFSEVKEKGNTQRVCTEREPSMQHRAPQPVTLAASISGDAMKLPYRSRFVFTTSYLHLNVRQNTASFPLLACHPRWPFSVEWTKENESAKLSMCHNLGWFLESELLWQPHLLRR